MDLNSKIYIAGHRGLVGSAILRRLEAAGYRNLVVRTSSELDLRDRAATALFFTREQPDCVFLAAARVGGILANRDRPAEFIHDNLAIQTNVIHQCYLHSVKKLLFLGSSCVYPKFAPQPLREEYLLDGKLEPTNEPYAVAKIAGITMCRAYNRQYGTGFISVMPANLYGPGDNFDPESSHVLPAMIRKFHRARINRAPGVVLWGTGAPRREFLYVDDLADACLFLMRRRDSADLVNIGSGMEITVRDLALLVKKIVGYRGEISWDGSRPDGTPRKLLDSSILSGIGWRAATSLEQGIKRTYAWFCRHAPAE
jgi:GDP-L-fucose synthase